MFFVYLLIFVPLSLVLKYLVHAPALWVFITSSAAIIPLAVWIQRGTEEIANRTQPTIGSLLNVTLGNASELILALFVLASGQAEVVKGQITGSIIGNGLLGLGLAVILGTWSHDVMRFDRDRAGLRSSMLFLVLIGLLLPAVFNFTETNIVHSAQTSTLDEKLSLSVSVVLILLYIASLVFTFRTHHTLLSGEGNGEGSGEGNGEGSGAGSGEGRSEGKEEKTWPVWRSLAVLVGATAFTAWEAELISDALTSTATQLGMSSIFLGVVVLALVGNVAEYVSGITFARRGEMDMVMSISLGATIQVGVFVAPLLVIISFLIGHPMNMVFNDPLDLVAILAVAMVVNAISKDGEVNWFEGALLVGVYLLMAIAFFFVSPR